MNTQLMFHGKVRPFNLGLRTYSDGNYAIANIHPNPEHQDVLSVWVPTLKEKEVCIKNYSGHEVIYSQLVENKVIEPAHRSVNSGFVTMPVSYLTEEFLSTHKPKP